MFDLYSIYDPIRAEGVDTHIHQLNDFIKLYNLNLNPDYQRDHVWTLEQSGAFVYHIFSGGTTPRLYITTPDNYDSHEILDGKQRFTALFGFVEGTIPLILPSGEHIYRDDIDPQILKVQFRRITLPFGIIKQSRKQAMELYVRLNSAGSVHTKEEIDKVKELLNKENA